MRLARTATSSTALRLQRRPPSTSEPEVDAVASRRGAHLSRPPKLDDVVHATRLPFNPGSPLRDCATADSPSFVEGFWSRALFCSVANRTLKPTVIPQSFLLRDATEGPFSLRRGLEPFSAFSNEHHLSEIGELGSETTRATQSGRPRFGRTMAQKAKPVRPLRGPASNRSGRRSHAPPAGTANRSWPWRVR